MSSRWAEIFGTNGNFPRNPQLSAHANERQRGGFHDVVAAFVHDVCDDVHDVRCGSSAS